MSTDDKLPKVRVDFCVSGKHIDIEELTNHLNLLPTETRTLGEWPDAVKKTSDSLPEYLRPRCMWEVSTEREYSWAISTVFEKMMILLKGKEQQIKSYCEEYSLTASFNVSVTYTIPDRPEMYLTREIIDFIYSLGADVGFDLYIE